MLIKILTLWRNSGFKGIRAAVGTEYALSILLLSSVAIGSVAAMGGVIPDLYKVVISEDNDVSSPQAENFTPPSFSDIFDVDPLAIVTSDEAIINGLDTPAVMNISGGEYPVNGGDFLSSPQYGKIGRPYNASNNSGRLI